MCAWVGMYGPEKRSGTNGSESGKGVGAGKMGVGYVKAKRTVLPSFHPSIHLFIQSSKYAT
jgi:hypothetical protein